MNLCIYVINIQKVINQLKNKMETSKWIWSGTRSPVENDNIPEWAVAFVYIIEHTTADGYKLYVGKKQLQSTTRKKIGVREKAATATRKTYKTTTKASNWQDYWGSSKSLKEAKAEGSGTWRRIIVEWCYSKKNATYCELKHQFLMNVLEGDSYNDNINGSLYRHDTNRQLYEEYREKMKTTPRKPRVKKQIKY